jgi:hypothetical protein
MAAEDFSMSDPLATYLQDHMAGAMMGVEILEALRDQHAGEPLGLFAGEMLVEVEADRDVLQRILDRVGGSNVVKEAAAWVGEKISRLKLSRQAGGELGTFEALETLALGILGKRSLWTALKTVKDTRIDTPDLEQLAVRAQSQYERVEARRLLAARAALTSAEPAH